MEADYPAAHSQDTWWFAVDRDGHVACFHSSEAGAVPHAADFDDPRQVVEHLALTEAVYDLVGRAGPGRCRAVGEHLKLRPDPLALPGRLGQARAIRGLWGVGL